MEGELNTADVLLNRGLNGAYGYGSQYGREFASDASNAVRIESASAANAAGLENLLDQNQFAATNTNIVEGHNRITDSINLSDNRINDNINRSSDRQSDMSTAAEFRSLDRQRDIERILNQNAKEAAACCCETQKLILSEGNETRALVLAVEARANVASLAVAQARITQLETIDALSQRRG